MEEKQVFFLNDYGEKLAGTFHIPDRPFSCGVVLGHCFTCSRHTSVLREIAKALAQNNIAALRFDFSGNGQSEGDFSQSSYTKHIHEIIKAAGFIRDQGAVKIGMGGHSMGASIAILAASRIQKVFGIAAIAGRVGISDTSPVFTKSQLDILREKGKISFVSRGRSLVLTKHFFDDMKKYSIPETIKNMKIPMMVIHGDKDEIIPVTHGFEAKRMNPDIELKIIEGAGHMFVSKFHRKIIAKSLLEWFKKVFLTDRRAGRDIAEKRNSSRMV